MTYAYIQPMQSSPECEWALSAINSATHLQNSLKCMYATVCLREGNISSSCACLQVRHAARIAHTNIRDRWFCCACWASQLVLNPVADLVDYKLTKQVVHRMQLSHAVLLAGGVGKTLHPLTSAGTPKALLSVGNQVLISFPLRTLEQGGVSHTIVVRSFISKHVQQGQSALHSKERFIFQGSAIKAAAFWQVVEGETATSKISHWISKHYGGKMHVDVKTVAEGTGSATAVAQLQDAIQASTFVVISGDLVTDVPLKVFLTTNPAITALLHLSARSGINCLGLTLQALAASHYVTEATVTALLKERRVPPALETKPGKAPKNTDYVGENCCCYVHPLTLCQLMSYLV